MDCEGATRKSTISRSSLFKHVLSKALKGRKTTRLFINVQSVHSLTVTTLVENSATSFLLGQLELSRARYDLVDQLDGKKGIYWGVIFLVFFSGLGSSLGSFISRIPSAILADAFSVSILSPNPMRLRNVENALSLCK